MKYRILGRTGLKVSEIGIGTWAMGGPTTLGGIQVGWGDISDKISIRTLKHCHNLGINFIDTADTYGKGHSEEIIGKALQGMRKKFIIATKCGNYENYKGEWVQNWNSKYIFRACENSLRRLKTDYIDLYQIHTPLPGKSNFQFNYKGFKAFIDLKKSGKILHYGYSSNHIDDALKVARLGLCDTIQIVYNLFNREAEKEFFTVVKKKNIGIIVRVPLASGFLTGKFSKEITFNKNDHRSRLLKKEIRERVEKIEKIRHIAESKPGRTLSQFALQFCLRNDAVSVVIPGAKTPEQLEENAKASNFKDILPEEITEINHNFY